MRLRDLQAKFICRQVRKVDPTKFIDGVMSPSGKSVSFDTVPSLKEAHGIRFLCPKCFVENRGEVGTHQVICWFVGKVPDDASPGPGRWTPKGTGLDDLTFVPGDPARAISVLLTGGGCGWHGYVKNGDAS